MELKERIKQYQEKFNNTSDLVVREFQSGNGKNCALIFMDNIIDTLLLSQSVISPLQEKQPENSQENFVDSVMQKIVAYTLVSKESDQQKQVQGVLNGGCLVLFEGSEDVLVVECAKWIKRVPAEPPTSAVLQGPREGFVEDIVTNIVLLRKRLKSTNFVVEETTVGTKTNSQVKICYLKDVADPSVVEKVTKRLNQIDIDGIIDSNYIATFLETGKHTLFNQVGTAEKPDVVAAKILEGRVAILVDGSPIALTVPFVLLETLQSSNDYYSNAGRATFLRWLRFFGAFMCALLPGVYVALLLYHYRVIPIKFLITITNSIQGIPLPPLLETLFIIFLFELLYEASLRMPRYLGLALSVVGALILGDTAVKAGLISPPAVLVVAITGVMSYTVPEFSGQLSMLRLMFTVIGGVLGIYAIIIGGMLFIAYLVNLQSYGSPYLAPYAPYILSDQKDGLSKKPITHQKMRPETIPNINHRRAKK